MSEFSSETGTNSSVPENGSSGSSSSAHSSDYEMVPTADGDLASGDNSPPLCGEPIQIVKVTEDRHFELDVEALSLILLKDNIKDKPVVVVSIAGDFRKGKSHQPKQRTVCFVRFVL